MRWLLRHILFNPFVMGSIGLVLGFLGASLLVESPGLAARIRDAERLRPVGAAAPGDPAFVEGRISPRSPVLYREFVAYVREEYRSQGETSTWVTVAVAAPALWIETAAGVVPVVNRGYRLEKTDVTVEEQPPSLTRGAVQARGFVRGSPVLAVGRAAEPGTLSADLLFAGDRAGYVAHLRRYRRSSGQVGSILLLAGIACLLLAVEGWRRFLREIGSAPAEEAG
jgi:hypothetical protein